jgi:hypothetical protein
MVEQRKIVIWFVVPSCDVQKKGGREKEREMVSGRYCCRYDMYVVFGTGFTCLQKGAEGRLRPIVQPDWYTLYLWY